MVKRQHSKTFKNF